MENNKQMGKTIEVRIDREIFRNQDETFFIFMGYYIDSYDELSIKINQELRIDGKYKLVGHLGEYQGKPTFTTKYVDIDRNSYDCRMNILCSIDGIKEKTAKLILDNFEGDLDEFKSENPPKIKGIGPGKLELIKEGLELLDNLEIKKELNMILGNKISQKNINLVAEKIEGGYSSIDEFKENPYKILIEECEISFNRADNIAQIMNVPRNSIERIKYLVEHVAGKITSQGNCYCRYSLLIEKLNEIGVTKQFKTVEDMKEITDKNNRIVIEGEKVYKRGIWEAENNIPFEIKDLIDEGSIIYEDVEKLINEYESLNHIKFDEYQRQAIITAVNSPIAIITGGAGCVDCDTEYFNGYEWKKISEYSEGEKVLQYNHFGNSELVYPLEYHKYKEDYLYNFKTKNLDQCLSDEHNVYYITSRNNLAKKTFKEIRGNHENSSGFKGAFMTTFDYSGKGLNYNDLEIRLQVAIKADGYLRNDNTYMYEFNLKKERKINRLENILNELNLKYTKTEQKTGYTRFYFNFKTSKIFDSSWYECSKKQFEIIFDEVIYWDCNYNEKNDFSTTIKENADFIQFVGSVCGFRSSINVQDRIGKLKNNGYKYKSIEYNVHFTKQTLIRMSKERKGRENSKTLINKYKTKDGYKYCFSVPSRKLVLRRNNKIFVTGNSGKTTLLKCVIFCLDEYGFRINGTAPTGKAARRFNQATKLKTSTIHSYLGKSKELYPHRNGVMIIDEVSMVDVELFNNCLVSMKESSVNYKKLIIVGDFNQLASVQPGNVLYDMIQSETIPVIRLTKTFRQGKDSNIINIANGVIEGTNFLPIKKSDFYVKYCDNSKDYQSLCLEFYQRIFSKYSDLDSFFNEVQFIAPLKKGDVGTLELNKLIKNKFNPTKKVDFIFPYNNIDNPISIKNGIGLSKTGKIVNNYESYIFPFDKNDKIMNLKNDNLNEIYNGEIGRIIDIDDKTFTVYFSEINKQRTYPKDRESISNFQLAYVCTIHKLQGCEFKYIAIFTAQDSTLCDRRLLYTAITRGKETVLLFTNKIIQQKIVTRNNLLKRDTFLKERLQKLLGNSQIQKAQ